MAYFGLRGNEIPTDEEVFNLSNRLKQGERFIFKGQDYTVVSSLERDGVSVGFYAAPF